MRRPRSAARGRPPVPQRGPGAPGRGRCRQVRAARPCRRAGRGDGRAAGRRGRVRGRAALRRPAPAAAARAGPGRAHPGGPGRRPRRRPRPGPFGGWGERRPGPLPGLGGGAQPARRGGRGAAGAVPGRRGPVAGPLLGRGAGVRRPAAGGRGVVCLFAAREGDAREFPASGQPELRLEGSTGNRRRPCWPGTGWTCRPRWSTCWSSGPAATRWPCWSCPGRWPPASSPGGPCSTTCSPLPSRLRRTFGERVGGLPTETRALLVVAAAETSGDPAVVLRAGARLGVDAAALDAAEAAGLVHTGEGRLQFRHPLVRSAAYSTATLAGRQAAHRALAEVLAGEDAADQRAWHLAAATVGPDEAVAAELERSAHRARRRGGHAAAAAALERAAELTGDDPERGHRLVEAVGAAWLAGQADRAVALADRAQPLATDLRSQAALAHLRGSVEASRGIALDATAMLVAASELAAPVDPSQALAMLVEASEIASYAGDVTPTAKLGRRAAALPVTDKTGEFLSDLLQGMGLIAEGDAPAGEPRLRRAIALAGTMDHPRRLIWAGVAAFLVGDNAAGDALFARAAAKARQDGAVGLLPQALEYLAPAELVAGRLDAAAATAGEGLRLARDTGNDTSACRHLCTLAHLAAIRGDEDACRSNAAEALDRAAARGLGLPPPWPPTPWPCSTSAWAGPPTPSAACSGCWPPPPAPAAPSSPSTPSPTWSRRPSGSGKPPPPPCPWPPSSGWPPWPAPPTCWPSWPAARADRPRGGGRRPLRGGPGPAAGPGPPV